MIYFAFGSNMSRKRLKNRGIVPFRIRSGWINDYKLVFNKKSKKNNQVGWANIEHEKGSVVYGILYWVSEDEMIKLDKFEGHPTHYFRTQMNVSTNVGIENAMVYIAQQKWIDESCEPTKKYINFLLEGRDFIPRKYYENLKKINVIDM